MWPYDFKDSSLVKDKICCKESSMNQAGCADMTVGVFYFLVISGSIFLTYEFFAIILVPFLIAKAENKNPKNIINYQYPTTITVKS